MEICRKKFRILKDGKDSIQTTRYCMLSFDVPDDCGSISLTVSRTTEREAQIPAALFDSAGKNRVFRAPEGTSGYYEDTYIIRTDSASSGAVPGPIPAGTWKLILYKRRFSEDFDAVLSVNVEKGNKREKSFRFTFQDQKLSGTPGWYRGELHVHSSESTGRKSVRRVLEAAREAARQIRLRNLSGIIIVDFINQKEEKNTRKLLHEFKYFLAQDPIQTTLVDMTALGLVEVTRKKIRRPLYEEELQ